MLFKSHALKTFVFNQRNDKVWYGVWVKLQKQQTKNSMIYIESAWFTINGFGLAVGCSAVKKEK